MKKVVLSSVAALAVFAAAAPVFAQEVTRRCNALSTSIFTADKPENAMTHFSNVFVLRFNCIELV